MAVWIQVGYTGDSSSSLTVTHLYSTSMVVLQIELGTRRKEKILEIKGQRKTITCGKTLQELRKKKVTL